MVREEAWSGCCCTAPPSHRLASGVMPGPLMIIGGAEDKLGKRTVLTQFVAASGGGRGPDAAVPTPPPPGAGIVAGGGAPFRRAGGAAGGAGRPPGRDA